MKNNYKEIKFLVGSDIERAVNELLEYKEKGILACGTFNGTTLYSDKVTVDSAYLEIIGKTKAEFDKSQEEWRENYRREEERHKASIPELSKEWIEKGHRILSEDKWELWDKCVPIRLGDLYRGMELGQCLDIIKTIKERTLEEAVEVMNNQGHSGMSWGLMKLMVKTFSDKGEEFVKLLNY
jgi:hypothetical protein